MYEAIDSVLVQDYPNLELLVTDDGTPDFPIENVRAYIAQRKRENIRKVLVVHHDENVGTVRNITGILKYAAGEYCVNLDGDDVFHHETVISEIIRYMTEHNLDYLGTGKIKCDEQLNEIEPLPSRSERVSLSRLNTPKKQLHAFAVFRFFNISSGTGMAYSRDCVRRMGLFDEAYRNWQDGPSLVSYVQHGKMIPFNPDIIAIKYRDGGVSNSPGQNRSAFAHISADRLRFIERVTIPDHWNPYVFRRRRILFRYYWDTSTSTAERLLAFLRYPEEGIRMRIQKYRNLLSKHKQTNPE